VGCVAAPVDTLIAKLNPTMARTISRAALRLKATPVGDGGDAKTSLLHDWRDPLHPK
jgi:hypothetical protein